MDILLVRPPRPKQAITVNDFMFSEPLGLEMLVTLLKAEHKVEIYDMMIETASLTQKLQSGQYDAVGVTSLCIDVVPVIALCREAKTFDPAVITLVGGTQAYLAPLSFADEAVDHIAEFVDGGNIQRLFRELAAGPGIVTPIPGIRQRADRWQAHGPRGRNGYFFPDRGATAKYRAEYSYFGYKPAAIMEYGIGCEKVCDFCLRWRIEGARECLLDLDVTRRELQTITEDTIMLVDNDFFAGEAKIRTFLELIRELGIHKNFITYASVKGILEFPDLVREFRDLGLKAVLVGYETFSDEELTTYRKKSTTGDNETAARFLRGLGIDVWASFMAHPDWTRADFKKFRRCIASLRPQISSINPLTPFPGLPLYDQYRDRLLFPAEDYAKWSFGQVTIRPGKLTLRRYYYELLLTNLYVNLLVNRPTEMLRRYTPTNLWRLITGSLKTLSRYVALMARA